MGYLVVDVAELVWGLLPSEDAGVVRSSDG
jgi:hypothetical protein